MKPETVITALQNVAAQQSAESSQRITDKLSAFTAARDTHAASMQELKEIEDMRDGVRDEEPEEIKDLKEFIGHRPMEVLVGVLLGIMIAMAVCLFYYLQRKLLLCRNKRIIWQ